MHGAKLGLSAFIYDIFTSMFAVKTHIDCKLFFPLALMWCLRFSVSEDDIFSWISEVNFNT